MGSTESVIEWHEGETKSSAAPHLKLIPFSPVGKCTKRRLIGLSGTTNDANDWFLCLNRHTDRQISYDLMHGKSLKRMCVDPGATFDGQTTLTCRFDGIPVTLRLYDDWCFPDVSPPKRPLEYLAWSAVLLCGDREPLRLCLPISTLSK